MLRCGLRLFISLWLWFSGLILLAISGLSQGTPLLVDLATAENGAALYINDPHTRISAPLLRIETSASTLIERSPDGRILLVLDQASGQGNFVFSGGVIQPIDLTPGTRKIAWKPDSSELLLIGQSETGNWLIERVQIADFQMHTAFLPDTLHLTAMSAIRWLSADRLRIVTPTDSHVYLDELVLKSMLPDPLQIWEFPTRVRQQPLILTDTPGFILPAETPDSLNYELYFFVVGSEEIRNLSNNPTRNDTYPVLSLDEQTLLYRAHSGISQSIVEQNLLSQEARHLHFDADARMVGFRLSPDQTLLAFIRSSPGQDHICVLDRNTEAVICPVQGDHLVDFRWWDSR